MECTPTWQPPKFAKGTFHDPFHGQWCAPTVHEGCLGEHLGPKLPENAFSSLDFIFRSTGPDTYDAIALFDEFVFLPLN